MADAQADNDNSEASSTLHDSGKRLPPAALRALKEAEERRKAESETPMPKEIGGRGGADPARFGDWEINGRAIDFEDVSLSAGLGIISFNDTIAQEMMDSVTAAG